MGVIPIINENDTISVSEILHVNKFGDNDTLSAIAAGMCGADYLFLMTDVDGLYEDNPRRVPGARRVAVVRDIEEVRRLVSTSTLGSSLGTGGMETKLIAAELATAAGCATVITMGSFPGRVVSIVQAHQSRTAPPSPQGPSHATLPSTSASSSSSSAAAAAAVDPGTATPIERDPPSVTHKAGVEFALPTSTVPPHTLFTAKPSPLSSRRFWILHGLTPRGTVYVDEGAFRAIAHGERDAGSGGNGGRLLAAGVLRVEGTFAAGQAVRVCVIRGRTGNSERRKARAASPRQERDGDELVEAIDGLEMATSAAASEAVQEGEEVVEFGRGLTNYNSIEIDRVKGLRRCVSLSLPLALACSARV